jgi:uncharacterized Zn finger protein
MSRYGFGGYGWRPYVSVAQRRGRALREMNTLRKQGVNIQPVEIDGRKITTSFWGQAWCDHLESFSDYANRLPRGRTYVRNGSVCHLAIDTGEITAKVSGSEIYNLKIRVSTLPAGKWSALKRRCSGGIGSLLELLQGKLSRAVMEIVTDRKEGLFPLPGEISFNCDCPDWAYMCKHVAAVLYGVGARLDRQPELLFKLRGVDHLELIEADAAAAVSAATSQGKAKRISDTDLSDVFGIDLDTSVNTASSGAVKKRTRRTAGGKSTKKAALKKEAAPKDKAVPTKKSARSKKATHKKPAVRKKAVARKKKVAKKRPPAKTALKKVKVKTARKTSAKKKTKRARRVSDAGKKKRGVTPASP